MKFRATDEQIQQICANAVNASIPMGLGHIRATSRVFKPEDFKVEGNFINLDYVQGRMVKLYIWRSGLGWEMRDDCDPEYQSWHRQYRSVEELLKSAGVNDYDRASMDTGGPEATGG